MLENRPHLLRGALHVRWPLAPFAQQNSGKAPAESGEAGNDDASRVGKARAGWLERIARSGMRDLGYINSAAAPCKTETFMRYGYFF